MLTKKIEKKQVCDEVSHNDVFHGPWNGFGKNGHFFLSIFKNRKILLEKIFKQRKKNI